MKETRRSTWCNFGLLKFRNYEKATKFEKISNFFWQNSCFNSGVVKTSGNFFQIFVDFSEKLNFMVKTILQSKVEFEEIKELKGSFSYQWTLESHSKKRKQRPWGLLSRKHVLSIKSSGKMGKHCNELVIQLINAPTL